MEALLSQAYLSLNTGLWVFFRISSMLMAGTFFGSRLIPRRIRLVFSLLLTIVMVPVVPKASAIDPMTIQGMIITAQQLMIGLTMGFIIQLAFQPFVVGGQLIAMQTGLGFASLIDPATGASVPLIAQMFLFLCTLIFLSLNVHLILLSAIAESFHLLPIGKGIFSNEYLWSILTWSKMIFSSAILIAMPAIFSLLIINFSFGLMTRASPQLNIFAVGFPFTLTLGLFIIYLTLPRVLPHIELIMKEAILHLTRI